MAFLHNIGTVAKYEAKTLRRSWFFRLFSLGALFIFTFMNIGVFSPVGEEDWDSISIPSTLPLVNLYLLNICQAIIVIFLAADFLKRDKKVDTNEVLYTRSMSNFEYVLGKTWGILRLFLGLDLVILSIGLLMNIISHRMTVDIMAYIAYLLLICVPTILFSLGLAFVLMSAIRNQAVTFLILLGVAALDMFYLWHRAGSLFDYMAFGIPLFKSGMIGFENFGLIASQRLVYFSLGAALVMATILLFNRLPQSPLHRIITIISLVIFSAGAAYFAYYTYSAHEGVLNSKEMVIDVNKKFENRDFPDITQSNIDLVHKNKSISASAEIIIINNNSKPLNSYIFSLNPDLRVANVSAGEGELKFSRTGHMIEINPVKTLVPGKSDTIIISYSGGINEAFCFPDYVDNLKVNPYRMLMLNVKKRQAFLESDFVLLTPEAHWYPVAALNYYPSNPARIKIDFTKFNLRAKDEEGNNIVSQGHETTEGGYSIFNPESPLTGITLAIGNYVSDTLTVDSVRYISFHYPGNDYYKKDLDLLKDTLPNLVSTIMRELETNFSTKYPFKTLYFTEVPVQFYSLPRESTQTRAELQPSMVLIPERLSTRNAGFGKQFSQQKKRMARNNQVITDKELQTRLFNTFARNTFISGTSYRVINGVFSNEPVRYMLGPSFYFFKNNFFSSEYPVINAAFETHLQKVTVPGMPQSFSGGLSDNDKANLILSKTNFSHLLEKKPMGDTIRTVLTVKGDWFFNLLRSKAGVEEFNSWFNRYIDEHQFRKVDIKQFDADVNERFGFGFYPYLENWFFGKEQPGFLIENLRAYEIVVNNRSRYQVTFNVSNPEPVAGLFNISFRGGGPGGRMQGQQVTNTGGRQGMAVTMQGRGMESTDVSKIIFMDSMQTKRIGILLDFQPRAMIVNTLFSKNIPGLINFPVGEVIKARTMHPFEGEEIIPQLQKMRNPSEIIVDNEDPGFNKGTMGNISPLKKLLGIHNNEDESYQEIRTYGPPEYWQPVVQSIYYGKYVLSSVYTRAGAGDRSVSWTTPINEPGYYDIYAFIGKTEDRLTVIKGPAGQVNTGERQSESPYKDMHYKIHHDEGVQEITVDFENAEAGWNNLGRYYLSDTARVELSNQSQGKMVIADAVRWVRQ